MKNLKFVFFGIIAALGSLFVEMLFTLIFPEASASIFDRFTWTLAFFAFTEELFKFAVIYRTANLSEKSYQVFSISIFVAIGFAATEVFLASSGDGAPGNDWHPLLGIFLLHLATGPLLGYAAFQRMSEQKKVSAGIFIFVFLIHLSYNSGVIYGSFEISTACISILSLLAFLASKRLIQNKTA